mmetsp:Transcript_46206/g.92218  ORF Transcript_46206/g.92218 Transcript_46206/m.92218 type:complete len:88 (+) Transcript_46206:310-573(+)
MREQTPCQLTTARAGLGLRTKKPVHVSPTSQACPSRTYLGPHGLLMRDWPTWASPSTSKALIDRSITHANKVIILMGEFQNSLRTGF